MNKTDLIKLLDEIFVPLGFKKKGVYWVSDGLVLSKLINLQKSGFGNFFYINFGYIIRELELGQNAMHIYNRFGSNDANENKRITELLDFENNSIGNNRLSELKGILNRILVPKIQAVNTEEDLLNELKSRPHLNDIPLAVKKHLNLIEY